MDGNRFGYFDYIVQCCTDDDIRKVCDVKDTKEQLIGAMVELQKYEHTSINDRQFIRALTNELKLDEEKNLSPDARRLLEKCQTSLPASWEISRKEEKPDYDSVFNVVADICWLQESVTRIPRSNGRFLNLTSDPSKSFLFLKRELSFLYRSGMNDFRQVIYLDEARKAKEEHPFRPTKHQFKYPEAKEYVLHLSNQQIMDLWNDNWNRYCNDLSIFFGLTATCMLATELRRQYL